MHFENHELHGNLMKGFHSGGAFGWNSFLICPAHVEMSTGNLRFEMILEPNGGIMFRCWNDDNSTNSEVASWHSALHLIWQNHRCGTGGEDERQRCRVAESVLRSPGGIGRCA